MQIKNVPVKATKAHIEKFLRNRLQVAGQAIPENFDQIGKVVIDHDKEGYSTGIAWFSSSNRNCLIELIKLHNKEWTHRKLKTYLMGFTYDEGLEYEDDEEEEDEEDESPVYRVQPKGTIKIEDKQIVEKLEKQLVI